MTIEGPISSNCSILYRIIGHHRSLQDNIEHQRTIRVITCHHRTYNYAGEYLDFTTSPRFTRCLHKLHVFMQREQLPINFMREGHGRGWEPNHQHGPQTFFLPRAYSPTSPPKILCLQANGTHANKLCGWMKSETKISILQIFTFKLEICLNTNGFDIEI